jgi:hypothetical protein
MRTDRRKSRVLLGVAVIGTAALRWGCSGVHLRPEGYDWVSGQRTSPAAVKAAKAALAEAQAAGAGNIKAARYPMAKAKEYLILAENELSEGDTAAAEVSAGIAKKAAEDAKSIAQSGK